MVSRSACGGNASAPQPSLSRVDHPALLPSGATGSYPHSEALEQVERFLCVCESPDGLELLHRE
jgi:hypothetical protein